MFLCIRISYSFVLQKRTHIIGPASYFLLLSFYLIDPILFTSKFIFSELVMGSSEMERLTKNYTRSREQNQPSTCKPSKSKVRRWPQLYCTASTNEMTWLLSKLSAAQLRPHPYSTPLARKQQGQGGRSPPLRRKRAMGEELL